MSIAVTYALNIPKGIQPSSSFPASSIPSSLSSLSSYPPSASQNTSTEKNVVLEHSYSIDPTCIGIFAPIGSKVSAALTNALVTWRACLRSKNIPEHRGGGGSIVLGKSISNRGYGSKKTSIDKKNEEKRKAENEERDEGKEEEGKEEDGLIPLGILRAYVTAIDTYSLANCTSQGLNLSLRSNGDISSGLGLENMIFDESIPVSSLTMIAAASMLTGLPGMGFLVMR